VNDPSDPPDLPPPPFQRVPQRANKRRREPITTEAIVDAAIKVLDEHGLDGLSMRRVGEELDTGAASLYWHVGSKDGLLDLIFDRVIAEQEVPEPDPARWREQLKDVAVTMRRTILSHRDVVRISIGRIPLGPGALRWADRVLGILRAGGLSNEDAVLGQQLLIAVVNGFTIDETGEREPDLEQGPDHEDAGAAARDYLESLPPRRFPNLVALSGAFTQGDQETRFETLLDIFIDGLAKRAEV
jgi:AcrR family transcriptional regulator